MYTYTLDTKNGDLKKKKKKKVQRDLNYLNVEQILNILLTSSPTISQLLMDVIHISIDVPVDSG